MHFHYDFRQRKMLPVICIIKNIRPPVEQEIVVNSSKQMRIEARNPAKITPS